MLSEAFLSVGDPLQQASLEKAQRNPGWVCLTCKGQSLTTEGTGPRVEEMPFWFSDTGVLRPKPLMPSMTQVGQKSPTCEKWSDAI